MSPCISPPVKQAEMLRNMASYIQQSSC
ncbi:hypothetical protein CKAH01_08271 [Colletotrichum kahawae]|uniref:Uncharacterized protein n=1 Tax=Colletotrichum kahawae TaxID=34407 RepID=A0AAE0D1Y7_COLKA|nr:hypothetical protein CKAH01_08271 [Colletotrichum kahawae]